MERKDFKKALESRLAGYYAVEEINSKELAALSHQEAMEITKRLFSITVPYRDPERSAFSGLINLQLYLKKLRT